MALDLVIRGADVVTPGHRETTDIGIDGGRIAQIGGTMTGAEEIAAGGLLAIPAGVDAHTHLVYRGLASLFESKVWVDDFWSGSRAAIAGGITTIGNMTFPAPQPDGAEESPRAAIIREMAGAAAEAAVDWFLHPVLYEPAALPDGTIAGLAEAGHASIKIFLSDPGLSADEPALLLAASAAKAAGAVMLLHCEDGVLLTAAGRELIAGGRGTIANFADARPVAAEVAGVETAIGVARRTGAAVYIVHLSSAAALDRCRRARAAGLADKLDPALDVVTARQGVADLETLMPMLYSEGVAAGRISLDRFVELTAANAARIFGLYPRKGVIAVGSDADIALWDPGHQRTVDGARMQALAGYSVYDGWTVRGWPRLVLRRGQMVLADGEITARPGDGRWLRRDSLPPPRSFPGK